ncbi:MAG: hypothetical protein PHI32_13270 [Dysgonamonadaceae bacterium]|nr:hypothetical protein [Dysgonamonadaceae bacterium]
MHNQRYKPENKEKIDFYFEEIERQGKLKFLGLFTAPNSIYFIPITFILFLILEFIGRFYFIPSLIAMYLIFERLAYGGYMIKLAEDCIVDEIFMEQDLQTNEVLKNEFPNDPLYVTNEDRADIVEKIVRETKHLNFFQRVKRNNIVLYSLLGLYFVCGLIVYYTTYRN